MSEQPSSPLFRFLFQKTILATLLAASLVLGGYLGYQNMVKENYPDLEIPQALIITTWAGASPELIEKEVTNPLEKAIKSTEGVKEYLSGSMTNQSIVSVEFHSDQTMLDAMQRLRTKVDEGESDKDFSKEADKPEVEEIEVTNRPIVTFVLYGDLDDALFDRVAQHLKDNVLERINGVKKAEISGNREEVVRVQLLPDRIQALGISATDVRDAIQAADLDMPWGRFENPEFTVTLKLEGRFRELEPLKKLPIARLTAGRLVRLEEIAVVRRDLDEEETRTFASFDGESFRKSVDLSVYKLPGKDTLSIIADAKAAMEKAARSELWPDGLMYKISSDESETIWEKLNEVFENCLQSIACVFIVLLFMLAWREALVAGLAIPVTFLGALVILWATGYTLNQMVLIGMVLALGLLVDDFILMVEGMHDALAEGHTVPEAQAFAIRTYAVSSLSGSLTTILAFLPLMMIGGTDGKFIRLIPLTAAICMTISYFISIFVVVPLSRYILREKKGGHEKKSTADRIAEEYSAALSAWLKVHVVAGRGRALCWIGGAVALFVVSLLLFSTVPTEMYPSDDGRDLGITVELPTGTDLETSQEVADALGEILYPLPYFESVTKYVGKKSPFTTKALIDNLSQNTDKHLLGFSCRFVPKEDREKLAYEYVEDMRPALEKAVARFPGATLLVSVDTGGSSSEDPIQIEISGDDMEMLRKLSADVQETLDQVKGVVDPRDTLGQPKLDYTFNPNREALNFHNLSLADAASQVRFAMTHDEVAKYVLPGTEDNLEIRLGTFWPSRRGELGGPRTWDETNLVSLINPDGDLVNMDQIVQGQIAEADQSITHKNSRRSVTVMAKTEDRTVSEIYGDFLPQLEAMAAKWPAGYEWKIAGEAEDQAETFGSAGIAMAVAAFLVFATMALVFDSFRQPFIIMLSVPFALLGTFLGFFLLKLPVSFPAFIGMISLIGIAVNDAIVMIETMNSYRRDGRSVADAAAHGSGDRLRPILSTTITTIVGLLPLAISSAGWMPLCCAIIFGLMAATVISLFVIPALYLLITPEDTSPPGGDAQAAPGA